MKLLHAVATGLVPPLCAACGRSCRPEAVRLHAMRAAPRRRGPLTGKGPPGIDRAWSSAPHEGVARDLVTALKYRRLLPVAELIAERIHWLAPADLLSGTIVGVPAAPLRLRKRGFDPTGEIAAALADRLGAPLQPMPDPQGRRPPGGQAPSRAHRPPTAHPRQRRSPAQRPPGRRRPHNRRNPLRLRPSPARRRRGPSRRGHLRPAAVSDPCPGRRTGVASEHRPEGGTYADRVRGRNVEVDRRAPGAGAETIPPGGEAGLRARHSRRRATRRAQPLDRRQPGRRGHPPAQGRNPPGQARHRRR